MTQTLSDSQFGENIRQIQLDEMTSGKWINTTNKQMIMNRHVQDQNRLGIDHGYPSVHAF